MPAAVSTTQHLSNRRGSIIGQSDIILEVTVVREQITVAVEGEVVTVS